MKPAGLITLSKRYQAEGIYSPITTKFSTGVVGFILGLLTGILISLWT